MAIAFQNTEGIHSQNESSTAAQTVFTFTPSANSIVKGIWLDTTNLTENTTITVQYQIDGTNYRTFQTVSWTTGMEDGVLIEGDIPVADSKGLRMQLTSTLGVGTAQNVPYEYWIEGLGSGIVEYTYTVTNSASGAAIGGVEVWVSTSIDGTGIVASGLTDSNGQIVFYLDNNQTFFFWRRHNSFVFENPDQETVSV